MESEILESRWLLSGRRALVTGATKGIGAAIAEELLALGAVVTRTARGADDLAALVENDRLKGFVSHGIPADIATTDGRAALLEGALTAMGGIDILINNAGTNRRGASATFSPDDYQTVMDTNLHSVWELSRLAHPHLMASAKETGDACIIQIGSVAGLTYIGSGAPYAMTKAALDQLARYLAVEWAGDGIRVNAVHPWYTKTPLANRVLDDPAFTERVLSRTPNRRIADPEDIAGIAAFLCLPAARHPGSLSPWTAAIWRTGVSDYCGAPAPRRNNTLFFLGAAYLLLDAIRHVRVVQNARIGGTNRGWAGWRRSRLRRLRASDHT